MEIWNNFSGQISIDFSVEKCPMLIGIMRPSTEAKESLSTFDYKCILLQQGDILTRTRVKSNRERLLSELIDFKKQFDENEEPVSK
jgi:hypothetical protein